MNRFVLPAVFVCLVIANNVNWGVSGIDGDSVINDLIDKTNSLENKNLSSIFSNPSNPFTADALPAINEGERLLKEKCLNISQSNDSYNTILEAKDSLEFCVSSLINVTELKQKIDKARPVGDVDVVFKEYCQKSPNFKVCLMNYTNTLDACLEESEKESKIIVQSVTEALLSFVCHDEGDRIALFYSEGGPDCFANKKEAIEHCVNKSFGKYNFNDGKNVSIALPLFKFEEPQCKKLAELQECVVDELKNCGQPTPANIVESLFHFVCQSTPCKNFKCNKRSAGVSLKSTIFVTALGSLSILLGRINY